MKAELLIELGLTKNEAIVYLTLLRLGESKTGEIIKEARFKSGKLYNVLDSLIERGLVAFVVKNNVKYYQAQNPKKLQEYIKSQKKDLEEKEKDLLKKMPELNSLYSGRKELCQVKVYEGVEGIRTALFYFLDKIPKNSIIELYGSNDEVERDIILRWRQYDENRKEKKIKTRIIMTVISKKGREIRKRQKDSKMYKFLKGTDVSNFMICKNIVLFFNFKQPNCILIENTEYAKQFKELFQFLWNNAKNL